MSTIDKYRVKEMVGEDGITWFYPQIQCWVITLTGAHERWRQLTEGGYLTKDEAVRRCKAHAIKQQPKYHYVEI